MKVTQYIGGVYSTNLGKRVYMKTHINNPFSARVYANFNEHYTSHDASIRIRGNYIMIHYVDATSSYNLKQSYVSS